MSESGKKKTRKSGQFHSKSTAGGQFHAKSSTGRSKGTKKHSFTSSTGMSNMGMPADQGSELAARVASMHSRWEDLAGQATLSPLFGMLEDLSGRIGTLPTRIAEIRRRGYIFGNDLESRADELRQRWPEQHQTAQQLLEEQRRVLERSARDAEMFIRRLGHNEAEIFNAESRLRSLESNINNATSRVSSTFDTTQDDVQALESELTSIEYLLDSLASASFKLYPDEHGVAVCRAVWVSDRDEPEGLLFLTDGRLIFEQREKKATKKVLFITTKSELVQEKLWETPVGALEEVEIQDKKKFLSSKELLTLRPSRHTRDMPNEVTVQLKGTTNEVWKSLINRVQSGDIEADKVGAPPPEEQAATEASASTAQDLPTKCPACGAQLPPIFKGMHEVSCEYCGTVVRF